MTAPLAVVLLALAASAAAAPCPVPLHDGRVPGFEGSWAPGSFEFAADSVECLRVLEYVPDFERLRAAAGLTSTIVLNVFPSLSVNAVSIPGRIATPGRAATSGRIAFTLGYLQAEHEPDAVRWTIAHELGHSLQEYGPDARDFRAYVKRLKQRRAAGLLAPADRAHWAAYIRRFEAQADATAQELLVRAGFETAGVRRGLTSFIGCETLSREIPLQLFDEHPVYSQRLINVTYGEALLARAAKAAGTADGARLFDGESGARDGGSLPVLAAAQRYVPATRLKDFDGDGRLLPGRLVSEGLRFTPLRPGAPLQVWALQPYAMALVGLAATPFARAVDGVAHDRAVAHAALLACGTPQADALAAEAGVSAWSRRITEHLLRRWDAATGQK